jgi:hypothetical protein
MNLVLPFSIRSIQWTTKKKDGGLFHRGMGRHFRFAAECGCDLMLSEKTPQSPVLPNQAAL